MNYETKVTILWIFCIVIVVLLVVKIELESENYDCNRCEVTLYNVIADRTPLEFGTFKISELYEEYKNGHCVLTWSPTQGYFLNG